VLLTVEANGAVILELERRLRVTEPIIKFLTVRIDEEEKRLAKVKALRGTRRKVSAEPATSSHAPSASAPSSSAPVAAPAPPVSAAPVEPAEAVQASA